MEGLVVFFDEGCLLCSGSVRFLHERDKDGRLWFAGLGSSFAEERREKYGLPEAGEGAATFAVLDESKGRVYFKSDGVARVLRELGGVWAGVGVMLSVVPRGLRDWGYGVVARNRRKWFGVSETCGIPPGSLRGKVLE